MAKETPYFSHDYYSRTSDEIQSLIIDYGAEAYGIYWATVEILHEEDTHSIKLTETFYKSFAKQMSTSVEQVVSILRTACQYDLFIFTPDDNSIRSNRVDRNIKIREDLSNLRSIAGKSSASKRALIKENSTSVEQVLTGVKQVATKERKGKEIKEKENKVNIEFEIFWDFYAKKVGSKEKCKKKWDALSLEIQEKIIATLPAFLDAIKDKQFQPHPETYLNQKRWEDELKPHQEQKQQVDFQGRLKPFIPKKQIEWGE